jgi:uncharacterized protein (DUF1499 family)
MTNDVSTGGTPGYPELQPRAYAASRERVFDGALATARVMRGWRVTSADATAGEIRAVASVFLTPFRDDVTIQVSEEDGAVIVNMRSASRVGRADLGVNARRIRAYLKALDACLSGES